MKRVIFAVMSVTLVAGAFAAPVVANDDQDQAVVTAETVTVAGFPPTPPDYVIPFPGKHANSVVYWEDDFFGKGWDCTKYSVSGHFTQPNPHDAAVGKFKDKDTGKWMIGIWKPAPPMLGVPNTYVWRMTCTDNTPPVLGAWRDLYVELKGPCEGSKYRIVARGDRSNRWNSFVWEYEHVTKGDQVANKAIDAGKRWWTNWRPLEPGSTIKASSPSTGEDFFETLVLEDDRSCWSGVNPGVRY